MTTRSSLARFHSGSLIQDLEARQNSFAMKGARLGQQHRTVAPFRGSVSGTHEPHSIQLLTQLTQCLTPTREWNALLFWLKKVRVASDRRELLTDWRQSSGDRTLFFTDIKTNLPRPLLSFQEQIRSDVVSLQVIPSGYVIPPIDPSQDEAQRWVAIFKQKDRRHIELDSWSNEELDLLQEWIEIRDQTLRRSAECVQQALDSPTSTELTGAVE
jgi:hypothetical protein